MDSEKAAADTRQYLGLFIGGEEYAVDILRVKEILQFDALTRVPGTPPSIRGVINVRGNVVPVVDLAVRFGLAESAITKLSCIVIVEVEIDGESTDMGVMADAVSQVVDLRSDEIVPPPAFGTRVNVEFLKGLGRSGRKFILILDVDRVLSVDELQSLAATATPNARPEEGAAESCSVPQVALWPAGPEVPSAAARP